jgi:uncharacterized protein YndB with AHSA1/START domain
MNGTYTEVGDRPAIVFERRLAHPVDAVWRAITEPAELAAWFPDSVEYEARVGGKMHFEFPPGVDYPPMDGEVLAYDPPRRFHFTWGPDELHFDLEPLDDGASCLLRLTDLLSESEKAARDAAGWHVCLDTLDDHLSGVKTAAPGSRPNSAWKGHYERYVEQGLPAGAEIPG